MASSTSTSPSLDEASIEQTLQELHEDLARKYARHSDKIATFWGSFSKAQRRKCLENVCKDGATLEHYNDSSIGEACFIVPEMNLRDISSGPDFLLDIIRHRATASLCEQYCQDLKGKPGDQQFIANMMESRGLKPRQSYPRCFTLFYDGPNYGRSFKFAATEVNVPEELMPVFKAGLCIPQSLGELVLQRQSFLLTTLNLLIIEILDVGSKTRATNDRAKKSDEPATAAISNLSIQERPKKLTLRDLVASAQEQRDALVDYLELLSSEPVVLAHAVNMFFFSQPGMVADEMGRTLPVFTDKYISAAVFDSVHSAIKAAAIWDYLCRLLELLESSPAVDKVYRAIILQEISNVCHLEYARAQDLLKRHVQTGAGQKHFKRIASSSDKAGNPKISLKIDPEELTRSDPQLHYVLQLCRSQTQPTHAVDWIKKLVALHEAYPADRENMHEREFDALGDLIVIVGFMRDLSPTISMPSLSRKKGQMFVSRSQALDSELNLLKGSVDLTEFAEPIDNLLEPGMTEAAMKELDRFIAHQAGSKIGFLYQDILEESLSDLENQYGQAKTSMDHAPTAAPLKTAPQPHEEIVKERKQKEKTRPSKVARFEIAAPPEPRNREEESTPPQRFKVSPSAAKVFDVLFKKSESRGSINWVQFESAMVELGFSVTPKFGSVFSFLPSETLKLQRSFTVHRPHRSRIEGHIIPIYARRLRKIFGWTEKSFSLK